MKQIIMLYSLRNQTINVKYFGTTIALILYTNEHKLPSFVIKKKR